VKTSKKSDDAAAAAKAAAEEAADSIDPPEGAPKAKAKAKAKKAAPKQCCSDFGQKCSDSEPCCPPNICSDLLGMCTLEVNLDKLKF